MRRRRPSPTVLAVLAALGAAVLPSPASSQDFAAVQIGTQALGHGVYMLTGQGGNIGVSVGPDGVFVIDDQYAPLTEKILAAIRVITPDPVRFVFNTHWHGDHTGGNENLGKAGALLVAHENVRARLTVEQVLERIGRPASTTPPAPEGAWPVLTFTEEVTFHLNGDDVHAVHVENAHTDGDAIVHFRRANVVHMGDAFVRDRFPFIDTATGGTLDGVIAAAGTALAVMDADTKVIPGHGALSTREDLRTYRDALKAMRDRIAGMIEQRQGLDAIQATRPIRDWAERWKQDEAGERNFVETIYRTLGGR
ncbi:MAG: MBL fold metallo-hydrolase [Longimicrobiales bacterium]|nr:MBL fold metallo-hydrolase [Longimicrobiales bacterium]